MDEVARSRPEGDALEGFRDYVADMLISNPTTAMIEAFHQDWASKSRVELWEEIDRRKMKLIEEVPVGGTLMEIDDGHHPRKNGPYSCVQCVRIMSKPYQYKFGSDGGAPSTIACDSLEYLFKEHQDPHITLFEKETHFFLYDKCINTKVVTWPNKRQGGPQQLDWRVNLVFNEDNFLLVKAWLSKCDKVSCATDKIFGNFK